MEKFMKCFSVCVLVVVTALIFGSTYQTINPTSKALQFFSTQNSD